MLARVHSCAVIGLEGEIIEVEVDTGQGLPGMTIVGLPDAAVQESRERVQAAIKNAGLPYPRAHLVRHTMASWLLAGGSSLKEVADVLRHRSLNTTLIYAKLDSRNLAAVALPWPGCAT